MSDFSPPRWIQAQGQAVQAQTISVNIRYANPVSLTPQNSPATLIIQNNTNYVLYIGDNQKRVLFRAAPRQTSSVRVTSSVLVWFSEVPCFPWAREAKYYVTPFEYATDTAQIYAVDNIYPISNDNYLVNIGIYKIISGATVGTTYWQFGGQPGIDNDVAYLPSGIQSLSINYFGAGGVPAIALWAANVQNTDPATILGSPSGFATPNVMRGYGTAPNEAFSPNIARTLTDTGGVWTSYDLSAWRQAQYFFMDIPALAGGQTIAAWLVATFPVSEWPYL